VQAPPGNRRLGKSPNQIGGGKPGPGRPKGVRIKFTEELKRTIIDALHNANDEGLFGFVRDTAVDTPTAALALLGRLIPVSVQGNVEQHHVMEVRWKPPQ